MTNPDTLAHLKVTDTWHHRNHWHLCKSQMSFWRPRRSYFAMCAFANLFRCTAQHWIRQRYANYNRMFMQRCCNALPAHLSVLNLGSRRLFAVAVMPSCYIGTYHKLLFHFTLTCVHGIESKGIYLLMHWKEGWGENTRKSEGGGKRGREIVSKRKGDPSPVFLRQSYWDVSNSR
jgi:hypothetical protein